MYKVFWTNLVRVVGWTEKHTGAYLLIIFLLSLALRLGYVCFILGINTPPTLDGISYNLLAKRMLLGEGYVNDWSEPTAFRPPIYPLFLASIYALTNYSLAAARIVQVLLSALTVLCLYGIARLVFNAKIAFISSLGWAIYPLTIYLSGEFYTESLAFFLEFASVLLLYRAITDHRWLLTLVSGILFGMTSLTHPNSALWAPVFVVWIFFFGVFKKPLLNAALFCAGIGIILTPWVIRNYMVFHSFVPLSSLAGAGLWTGNNDLARGGGVYLEKKNWPDDDYPERMWFGWDGMNEVQSSQKFTQLALTWIKENPDKFLRLVPNKLFRLWSPLSLGVQDQRRINPKLVALAGPPYLVFLSLALIGLWIFRKKWLLAFPLLGIPLVISFSSVLTYGSTRYGIPMILIVIMYASAGLLYLLEKFIPTGNELATPDDGNDA